MKPKTTKAPQLPSKFADDEEAYEALPPRAPRKKLTMQIVF